MIVCILMVGKVAAEVCAPHAGSPTLCVAWTNGGEPLPGLNFEITYFDPSAPTVLLSTGSNWSVYSKSETDPNLPGAIADIRFDRPEDMMLLLARPDGSAGASIVGDIDLRPTMEHGSELVTGSHVAGNLIGDVWLLTGTGANGALHLTVDGIIRGNVTATTVEMLTVGGSLIGNIRSTTIHDVSVGGDLDGNVNATNVDTISIGGDLLNGVTTSTLQHLSVQGTAKGNLFIDQLASLGTIEIGGDLESGTLSFVQPLRGGTVKILGDVARTASMIFYGLESVCVPPNPCAYSLVSLNENGGETWGNIDIRALPNQSGISQNQNFRLYGPLMSSGSIEIHRPIRGKLDLKKGGSGTIFTGNGGQIVGPGQVILGYEENAVWSGSAEFDGINIGSSSQNGHLRIGTLKGSVTMSELM